VGWVHPWVGLGWVGLGEKKTAENTMKGIYNTVQKIEQQQNQDIGIRKFVSIV